jgi:diguanylate cyclase
MDLPCRYGGEEFGIILPATETAGACAVAERIRQAVESSVTICGDKKLKVTCSLGLAQVMPFDDATQLIRRADDALYASKKAGRNCGHWGDGTDFYSITATEKLPERAENEPSDDAQPEVDNKSESGSTFLQSLKRRVTESHRFGVPLTIMHLKIDDYESVIQRSGKAAGRQMVEQAEDSLERSLRTKDLLVRLDDGEFVVLLPGNTETEAAQLVKRMRIAMANCVLPLKDRELELRFRHSIAELLPKETAQELLARARRDVPGVATQKAVDA